jgi:hypothetical protein
MAHTPTYTRRGMERRLGRGNVGEAVLRLWMEDHLAELSGRRLEFVQWGFNPADLVEIEDKREELLARSDPDFVLVEAGRYSEPLLGVSSNSQKGPYNATHHMGGGCIRCPHARSCVDGEVRTIWYNEYNITNDYPKFVSRTGALDVLLVTILLPSLDSAAGWIKKHELETALFGLITGLPSGTATEASEHDRVVQYLRYGARGSTPRPYEVFWETLSGIQNGRVATNRTGSRTQAGPPKKVVCVLCSELRGEDDFKVFLQKLSAQLG